MRISIITLIILAIVSCKKNISVICRKAHAVGLMAEAISRHTTQFQIDAVSYF